MYGDHIDDNIDDDVLLHMNNMKCNLFEKSFIGEWINFEVNN